MDNRYYNTFVVVIILLTNVCIFSSCDGIHKSTTVTAVTEEDTVNTISPVINKDMVVVEIEPEIEIPLIRTLKVRQVEITGLLKKYIRVVDGTYYLKHNPGEYTVSIAIKIELIKKPTIEDFSMIEDKSKSTINGNTYIVETHPISSTKKEILYYGMVTEGELYLDFIDTLSLPIRGLDGGERFCIKRGNRDGDEQWKKIDDLLHSTIKTQKTIILTSKYVQWNVTDKRYISQQRSLINEIMSSTKTFELVDNAFDIDNDKTLFEQKERERKAQEEVEKKGLKKSPKKDTIYIKEKQKTLYQRLKDAVSSTINAE